MDFDDPTADPPIKVSRLTRFGVTTRDPARLADFYRQAFGCRVLNQQRRSGSAFETLMGVKGGADSTVLMLGDEIIELLAFDEAGMPYPPESTSNDPIFQHFAIVVDSMPEAYVRLSAIKGWTPISNGGPQQLPQTSGGVIAFKFRDPDGHPLELLQFPNRANPSHWPAGAAQGPFLGIDHSAITVRDTNASLTFYADLGFAPASRSLNKGPEQQRLDGLGGPVVDVLALTAPHPTPHLELLGYRNVALGSGRQVSANDVAASRLTLECADKVMGPSRTIMRTDPDGHHLIIEVREVDGHGVVFGVDGAAVVSAGIFEALENTSCGGGVHGARA